MSVVIPTRGRPDLVQKAIASALAQDFGSLEVIVVIDGDDPGTRASLGSVSDPRLRVIEIAVSVGGSQARNVGVRKARGKWIAFLDDDDEWLPQKLSRQIVAARRGATTRPVISSRLIARTPSGEMLQPLREHDSARPVSEFLFCKKSFRDGPFALQTSTLMASREMLLALPFRNGLPRHQDWDWLLRAEQLSGVEFVVMDEPLVVVRIQDERASVSRSLDWRFSYAWGREMRAHFSPKAYSWFLASECATRAAKCRAGFPAYWEIAREFFFHGFPTLRSTTMLLAFVLLPQRWREGVRRVARGCRVSSSQNPASSQKSERRSHAASQRLHSPLS